MTYYELKNIAPEDIEDLFLKVEESFEIKIEKNDSVNTIGQLSDLIINKLKCENREDCTTQQVFYKIREAISIILQIEKRSITPKTLLTNLFPKETRRIQLKELENHLDLKFNVTRPHYWLTNILYLGLLGSFIGLFFVKNFALLGIVFFIFALWYAYRMGIEFKLNTLGQFSEKMTREHYLASRRDPKTYNKNEIEPILIKWFVSDLNLDKNKITRDTKFEY